MDIMRPIEFKTAQQEIQEYRNWRAALDFFNEHRRWSFGDDGGRLCLTSEHQPHQPRSERLSQSAARSLRARNAASVERAAQSGGTFHAYGQKLGRFSGESWSFPEGSI
jgi:hypothetical protein